mgnify:CR=1 FL=1
MVLASRYAGANFMARTDLLPAVLPQEPPPPRTELNVADARRLVKRYTALLDVYYTVDFLHNGLFVTHNDIKFDNVSVDAEREDRVTLIDFGVTSSVCPVPPPAHPHSRDHAQYAAAVAAAALSQEQMAHDSQAVAAYDHALALHMRAQAFFKVAKDYGPAASDAHAEAIAPMLAEMTHYTDVDGAVPLSARDISRSLPDLTSLVTAEKSYSVVGTPKYMSWQLLQTDEKKHIGGHNAFKSDVYALGVMLFVVALGGEPYSMTRQEDRPLALQFLTAYGARKLLEAMQRSSVMLPAEIDALEGMLNPDENLRWGIKQAITAVETAVVELMNTLAAAGIDVQGQ